MGCDGGTIPRRDELVRTKQKPEQKDKAADLDAKWKHCAITQEPLREPVMACELGRLYNKESALEFLIDRSKFECAPSFQHLRGLKDLKELKLTENKNFNRPKNEKGDGYIDTHVARYICPVVGLEMNGSYKFCYLWNCGCVVSEKALKELKGENCHKCGKPFTSADIITLNGTDEEVDKLTACMNERRLQAKLDKKAKKSKKQKCETASSDAADVDCGPSTSKQPKLGEPDSSTKLTNGHTASHSDTSKLTNGSKVSKLGSDSSKLMKGIKGSKLSTHSSANGSIIRNPLTSAADVLKAGGSIQKDTKASSVYKSLFTTCDKAKNQQKGHWVTSNPYWM